MNNEPVAYVNSMCNDDIDWKADPMSIDGQPLYTHPVNTCKHGVDDGACKECYQEVTHPVEEFFEDEPQAEELHEILQSNAELTDEEIMNIFDNWTNSKQEHNLPANNQNYFYQEMLGFARAILRKAQEK